MSRKKRFKQGRRQQDRRQRRRRQSQPRCRQRRWGREAGAGAHCEKNVSILEKSLDRIHACNLRAVARDRGSDRGHGGGSGRSLSLAGDLDGGVLDRGEDGGVALGDGSGGVRGNADRGLRSPRELSGGVAGRDGHGDGAVDVRGVGRDLRNLGNLRDLRLLSRDNRAHGGRDGDGLGSDDGAVGGAVRDLRSTVGDGDDVGGVDGRGGHGDGGRLDRAVGDVRVAVSDGDQAGGVVGGHGIAGHGASGQEGSSNGETHLEAVWLFG